MTSRNETIVRDAFEMTFNQGALEEMGRFFSADVRRHSQASPYADHGLPALWGHIQTVRYACPDGRLDLNDAIIAEDLVDLLRHAGRRLAGLSPGGPGCRSERLHGGASGRRQDRRDLGAGRRPGQPGRHRCSCRSLPGHDAGHGVSWPDDRDFG